MPVLDDVLHRRVPGRKPPWAALRSGGRLEPFPAWAVGPSNATAVGRRARRAAEPAATHRAGRRAVGGAGGPRPRPGRAAGGDGGSVCTRWAPPLGGYPLP